MKYSVKYSKRKTISISIDEKGNILVKAPYNVTIGEIEEVVSKHSRWIDNKINQVKNYKQLPKDKILFLGEEKKININIQQDLKKEYVVFTNDEFSVYVTNKEHVKIVLKRYLIEVARNIIKNKINKYSLMLGVSPNMIRMKDTKTRWGSCSYVNNLNFNYRLVMAREDVLEYVVLHEMCHIIHKNHSKEFYNLVGSIMKDYKEKELYLRENGYKMKI
ncbi:M48 family metallopeptidase [Clostridium sp. MSJ-8]|uniref:M48 family metallopeptidase n=1 Tax=Clostridium sp. MSJ-8 TaxID=2841510 RepID=UPI001C0E9C6C|nr:SprT family zinc-dependent metalloprotease [Clostridium sp. MSJ-8]MBU5487815.1 M48 family metallopeptidase [Clostridium sp. MSJ-8]